MSTLNNKPKARIYVSDYGTYNNGEVGGQWIDIETMNAKEMQEAVDSVLKENAGEEVMYQDYEGFPKEFYSESFIDFEKLADYLALYEHEQEQFDVCLYEGYSLEQAFDSYEDVIIYDDWYNAIDYFLECCSIPDNFYYIDRDAIQRDLELEGYFETESGKIAFVG